MLRALKSAKFSSDPAPAEVVEGNDAPAGVVLAVTERQARADKTRATGNAQAHGSGASARTNPSARSSAQNGGGTSRVSKSKFSCTRSGCRVQG